jgi:hypothetical protein
VVAFLIVQACDGVLTYIGLMTLTCCNEGNPILASLMAAFGLGPGLTGAKLLAASLGILLHLAGVHRVLVLLTGIYFALAVVPWTVLLIVF